MRAIRVCDDRGSPLWEQVLNGGRITIPDDTEASGFPLIGSWHTPSTTSPGGQAYGPMIEALREFLDRVAGSKPDEAR